MPVALTTQSFRYELAPTQEQDARMRHQCDVYRRMYNHYIALRRDWWVANKDVPKEQRPETVTPLRVMRALTSAMEANENLPKETRDRFLSDLRSVARKVVNTAIFTAEDAYVRWFKRVKKGEKSKPPRFKSRRNPDDMCYTENVQRFRWTATHMTLSRLGPVRSKESLVKMAGRPTFFTLTLKAGRWYISVTCLEVPRDIPERTDTERVGVDLGVRKLAVLSTGEVVTEHPDNVKVIERAAKRALRLQRSLSRKQAEATKNGTWDRTATSAAYQAVRAKLQVAHAKLSRCRLDRSHKLSSRLVNDFRTVVLEDLKIQTMVKPSVDGRHRRRLNRMIYEKCLNTIRRQVEYKAPWHGADAVIVPHFYPSSKVCSGCGRIKQDLGSSETYECGGCGLVIDRDYNAAINLKNYSPEAQERLAAQSVGERVDCLKARKGAKAGPVKRSKKHVQDPQGKPDAGVRHNSIESTKGDTQDGGSALSPTQPRTTRTSKEGSRGEA